VLRGVPSEDAKRVGPDYLAAPLRLRHCHGSKLDADARSCGASYIRVSKGLARLPAAIVMVAGLVPIVVSAAALSELSSSTNLTHVALRFAVTVSDDFIALVGFPSALDALGASTTSFVA
jgi:hypothetical protein